MDQYQLQTAALMATHQMDIDLHRSAMAQRDREIAVNHHALADRDTTIGNIGKALSEYLDLIGSMNQRKQDYERRILDLSSASEERNAKLNRLVMEHDALLADMADLRNSWGNRLGSTVRRVFGFGSVPLPGPQGQTGNAAGGPSTGAAGAPVSDLDALLRLRGSQFIESLYRTLLRRPPDPDGFRHYRRKIDAGANLMQLVSDVANSAEAVNKRVVLPGLGEAVALHRTSRLPVVGRRIVKPDFFRPSEIPAGLGRKLLKVDELVALDDGPFLDKAYHLILKRKADPEGVAFYQNKLRRGVPALVILEDLLDSPEAASLGADSLAWRSQVRWRRVASQPIAARLLPLGIPAHLKKIEPDQVSGNDGGVPGGAVVGSSMVTVAPASELGGWKSLAVKGTQGRAAPTSQVCVSVIMAAYKTPLALLRQTIASVQSQSYTRWELCICNDGSADPQLERLLEEYVKLEPRVRLVSLDANTGIATATNKAMELASGEFMAFLDHDDELTEDALEEVVRALSKSPDTDILYSDQDKIDESGRVLETFYKPDWSPDYLRRVMYVGHLLVVRSTLARQVGGFDPEFNRVQDYEFVLRLSEVTKNIIHVPKVLYHWRAIEGSIASTANAKGGIENLQCLAVQNHLNRLGLKGAVQPHPTFAHRAMVLPQGVGRDVRVSIIIPSKNHPEHIGRCLQSIFERSTYKNFEVIVVDNGTTDPEALAILALHPITVVPYDEKFSYSRANNLGAARASGEVLVLLNNDTEVLTDNWIELLLSNLWQSDIGVVGPMLVYPDRTVQHAGIVVGPRGTADHVMRGFPATSDGYAGSLSCVREVSGITGACLMTRLETYVQAGGLSELYATHYQDVDFCLGVRAQGKRILHVPEARLMHYESASRGNDYDLLDRLLLQDSWRDTIANGDPYFNPAFSLQRLDYSLRVV